MYSSARDLMFTDLLAFVPSEVSNYVNIALLQISLEVGDIVGVAGNHWDGFNKGRNHRTNRFVTGNDS